jgi:Galactose oxidase, central domain
MMAAIREDYRAMRFNAIAICLGTSYLALIGCGDRRAEESTSDEIYSTTGALSQLWTQVQFPGTFGINSLQLLMDGSVLASESAHPHVWHRFIPDPVTGYWGGAWVAAGQTIYGRDGFITQILRDGRFFVGGGEYVSDQNGNGLATAKVNSPFHSKCEVYNLATNSWAEVPRYPLGDYLADGVVAPLSDGKLLIGGAGPGQESIIFDPVACPPGATICPTDSTRCFYQGACINVSPWGRTDFTNGPLGFGEGSLTQLQNGNVFLAENGGEVYVPNGSPAWQPFIAPPPQNPYSGEGAPALTLYDGKVLITATTGFNAIYNPSTNVITNVATTPPPNPRMDESDQLVLPTGNALLAAVDINFQQTFAFYEFTPPSTGNPLGSFSSNLVAGGVGPQFVAGGVAATPLPDGTALVAQRGGSQLWIYSPSGPQLTTFGQPTISSVSAPVNGVYTLSGTTLNGLTNGVNMDDENQNFTSFPIVWVNRGSERWYCNVTDPTTRSIAPGASVTLKFTLPKNLPPGPLTVAVSASGLQGSNAVPIAGRAPFILPPPPRDLLLLD